MTTELTPRAIELANCARTLLASGGYNSFSYADISKTVGISKASIHHHFPSKADMVKTVLLMYREDARVGLAGMGAQFTDPVEQLQAYTGYWAACIRDGDSPFCVCAMLAAELPVIPEAIADEVQGHFQDLSTWVTAVLISGASQGKIKLLEAAEKEAMNFVATVHGAMLAARAYKNPDMFDAVIAPLMARLTSV